MLTEKTKTNKKRIDDAETIPSSLPRTVSIHKPGYLICSRTHYTLSLSPVVLLCGNSNRPHYVPCPYACPSVHLSRTGSQLENDNTKKPKLLWTFPRPGV